MFVDDELAGRIEAAQARRGVDYARARHGLRPEAGAGWMEVGGGHVYHAGAGSPVYGAAGLGMAGPVAAADLDAVEAFLRARGAAPRVDLCPLADGTLAELLRARGYGLERFESVLVARLPLAAPPAAPGPAIRRAGPGEAELWIRASSQGFAGADEPPATMLDLIAPNFHSPGAACFLALLDGEPAGAGALFVYGDTAELGGASTRPRFRGRGVQAALLAHRLAAAAEAGADLAVVTAAPGSASQRNAQRAGMALAYTTAVMALR